jgi:hypothetical protein
LLSSSKTLWRKIRISDVPHERGASLITIHLTPILPHRNMNMSKTSKSTKPAQSGPTQSFVVLSPITHDGEQYDVGSQIFIDHDTFEALADTGAVEGEWSNKEGVAT